MTGPTADDQARLQRAADLIRQRQYDRARILLRQMPDNPTAQQLLTRLDEYDPAPTTFEEAQAELDEAHHELEEAEEDFEAADERRIEAERQARRGMSCSVGVLIFLGSLIGSLLGAAADLGEAVNTVHEARAALFPDPRVCVVGSDTILGEELGLAPTWEDAFEDLHDVRLDIQATGSGTGVKRIASGDCGHVLAMSEPISEEQIQLLADSDVELVCAAEIGYDIIAFITDINNPVTTVSPLRMSRILKGGITTWNQINPAYVQPITILARKGSGTTDYVLSKLAYWDSHGGEDFPPDTNYVFCASNDDCLDKTLGTPGSIYWSSAAWIRIQPEQYLRALSILQDDEFLVNPLTDRVNLDDYPRSLMRPLYLYVVKSDAIEDDEYQLAREFFRFVRGLRGQEALDKYFYTYFDQPVDFDVPLPPAFVSGEGEDQVRVICTDEPLPG